jgi:thymidylate synthase
VSLILRNIPPISYIREQFLYLYGAKQFTEGRQRTVDITALQFNASDPALFGAPDLGYIEREKQWYLSQSLKVKDIPGDVPKIWKEVADDDGVINSNYGWVVFSKDNHHQFMFAVNQLKKDTHTRRAVIQFNRPSMTRDFNHNGRNDYMCTYSYQFNIDQAGALNMMVYMRSCDMIYGYPNDLAWATYVRDRMLEKLNSPAVRFHRGLIIWHCGSGHIYDRHFYLLDYFKENGQWNVDKKLAKEWVDARVGTSTTSTLSSA